MKTTHAFFAPVIRSTQSKVDTAAFERSLESYNGGDYREALHLLLDTLNPEFRTKYGNGAGTEFRIPHGSILVRISLDGDRLRIGADFLRLPERGRVAMLRQVADLNLNLLLLPRFRKEGDRLRMEYECPLSQSHPHKIYHVLRNICHVGDRYDDEFCTKFGAERCYEPCVVPYPPEEVARIDEAVRTTCRETLEAARGYEAERKFGYAWSVIDTAFYKIAYFARPQGQFMNELDKAVDDMDRELPVVELLAKGRGFLEKVLAMPREELAANLYYVDTLVSTKLRMSLGNVQESLRDLCREAADSIQAGNNEGAVLRMLCTFYEMYYYNDVQDDLNAVVSDALARSAGKPVDEAAAILYAALDRIMAGDLGTGLEETPDGIPAPEPSWEEGCGRTKA